LLGAASRHTESRVEYFLLKELRRLFVQLEIVIFLLFFSFVSMLAIPKDLLFGGVDNSASIVNNTHVQLFLLTVSVGFMLADQAYILIQFDILVNIELGIVVVDLIHSFFQVEQPG
jgi:hypothetical protein